MNIKKKQHISVYSIFFFLLMTMQSNAAVENIRFQTIPSDSGLSQQTVISIHQDSKGYMWFGTQEGLNKYDGIKFVTYLPKYNDPFSISSAWINSIAEDANGNIWAGTRNGLDILDTDTNKFTQYTSGNAVDSLNDRLVRVIFKAQNGTMWVGTRKGLNQFLEPEKRFKHYNFYGENENENINIAAITEDIAGSLWLGGSRQGLMRFDPILGEITLVAKTFITPEGQKEVSVRSLYLDNDQVLWIGTSTNGLFKLDLKRSKTEPMISSIKFVQKFSNNAIMTINEDKNNRIWLGTDKGLFYKNENDTQFRLLDKQANGDSDLSSDEVWSLYPDRSSVLWVGTFNGLHKWNTRTTQFDHFTAGEGEQSLSSGITSMVGTDKNYIYVGTRKGLNVIDRVSGEISQMPLQSEKEQGLKHATVMSFAYVSEQEIWFGYSSPGASKYNPITKQFLHYEADNDNKKALPSNGVTSIISSKNNTVWLGTFNGGLVKYNRATDDFTTYLHDPADISTLSSNRILALHESSDGNIWAGTWDAGVNVFVPSTSTAFRIRNKKGDEDSLGGDRITSILEDSQKNTWIGTTGGGLNLLTADRKERGKISFEKLDTENGMPSNVVYGLLEGSGGQIWASTNKGLVRISKDASNISIFTSVQGIQDDEFNSGTHHKDQEGFLYFGGNNGVTRFKPENVTANPTPPQIVFTGFQRLNKSINMNDMLNDKNQVEINYTDYLIGFEFAALDFAAPLQNKYRYMLEGFDQDWIDVRDSTRATYTNLPSGQYTFRVKAANHDGIWNEQGESIALMVTPAPWFSWWAYTIYGLLSLTLIYFIARFYKRKAELRNQYQIQLQTEVNIRTSELQIANEKLLHASITDQLTGLHNRRYLSDVIDERIEFVNDLFANTILDDKVSANSGPRLMALMFDLDGFKPINDNYGHDAGDKVILQVAKLLKDECRENDIVIRWGGDEYMVVAVVKDVEEATAISERIRLSIANHAFDVGLSNKFHLSSSLGFALYPFSHYAPHSITWDQVHLLADHALYKSKGAGRNTWTGIVQSEKDLPFSVLNSLVPNVDKAIEKEDVILLNRKKHS